MEIFLLPPFGLGGKFGFSLCAQTRTEKLLRGGKIGRGGIRSIDFGVKPFKKGLAGFKRTESFACTLCWYSLFFTASKTFLSKMSPPGDPKNNQKKTEPADFKETSRFSILDYILGLAAQDDENRNVFLVVKKFPHRFRVQMRGFAPSIPTNPFLKGLILKSIKRKKAHVCLMQA